MESNTIIIIIIVIIIVIFLYYWYVSSKNNITYEGLTAMDEGVATAGVKCGDIAQDTYCYINNAKDWSQSYWYNQDILNNPEQCFYGGGITATWCAGVAIARDHAYNMFNADRIRIVDYLQTLVENNQPIPADIEGELNALHRDQYCMVNKLGQNC